jgi:hypothetical protein
VISAIIACLVDFASSFNLCSQFAPSRVNHALIRLPPRRRWTSRIDLICGGRLVIGVMPKTCRGARSLRHLVGLLASDPLNPPLGEIVSTDALTKAMPIAAGEV